MRENCLSGLEGGARSIPCSYPYPGPWPVSRAVSLREISMNRRICRQVLDCGDGVREVTALALAALKSPKLAAGTATPTESGDCEDSVAAVQGARVGFYSRGRKSEFVASCSQSLRSLSEIWSGT